MKQKTSQENTTCALIAVFILGLGIMLYPFISNQWNKRHSSRAIASYDEALVLPGEEVNYDEIRAAAEAHNEVVKASGTLCGQRLRRYDGDLRP